MPHTSRSMIALIFTLGTSVAILSQPPTGVLQTPVHNYEVHGTSMAAALRSVAKEFKIGIGINEITPSGDKNEPVGARVENGNLSEVLNALMRGDSRYEWKADPLGFVHVTRKNNYSTLPDIALEKFVIDKIPVSQLSNAIGQSPEVQKWVSEHHCPRREMIVIVGGSEEAGPFVSLRSERRPLRSVLDDLALRTGSFFWSVSEYDLDGQCFSTITF